MDGSTLLANLLIDGLVTGSIYALIAVGFSLMWWLSDIVHLAHSGVMLVTGYVLFAAAAAFQLPLPVALLLGIFAAAVVGFLIDATIYKPLQNRKTGEMGLITASLGILIIVEFALTIAFGPEGVRADAGALRSPLGSPMLIAWDGYAALAIGTSAFCLAVVALAMRHTRLGKEMRAVAENHDLARVLGIQKRNVQRATMMLASALVVPASAFYLFNIGITPHETMHVILIAAGVAIIGGRGSILGALLGGLLVGIAESVMVWFFDAGWRLVVTFSLLYVLLLVRPQGIFGKA